MREGSSKLRACWSQLIVPLVVLTATAHGRHRCPDSVEHCSPGCIAITGSRPCPHTDVRQAAEFTSDAHPEASNKRTM